MTKIFHIPNLNAKWPGSMHDLRMFRDSHLCTLFESGKNQYLTKTDGKHEGLNTQTNDKTRDTCEQ